MEQLLDVASVRTEDERTLAAPSAIRKLVVYLVKPARYDDEGYVVRHWRGVLPSNTLGCLAGLTEDVRKRRLLGDHVAVETHLVDEAVMRVPVRRIVRASRRNGTRLVVALAGVQTNQFARASDLARQFRAQGVTVMIGGFHVSGMTAMFPEGTPDIAALTDIGVTVVAGEVEEQWGQLLSDVANDRLELRYNFLNSLPDLRFQPVPKLPRSYLKRFAVSRFGTVDTSRGCPFNCSFCTIINVQGRKMRCRDAAHLRNAIIENYRDGISFYFFTDDNFGRNKTWRAILDELIALREKGYNLSFMMQVDVQAYRIPNLVDVASRAGCTQVFIGLESVNPENLKAAGKNQNDVSDYGRMVEAWHAAGVVAHVGYIIGFPFDTPQSVSEDVRRLAEEVKVDQASFFMLTPLPGSQDHKDLVEQGGYLDPDFNNYDSFHAATRHPKMSGSEWLETYKRAWRQFYRMDTMKAILRRGHPRNYWNLFTNFMWYKNSFEVEDSHPMATGFLRRKARTERRPGLPIEPRWRFFRARVRELKTEFYRRVHLLWELQELWLQTRRRTEVEARIADTMHELVLSTQRARLRLADWQQAFAQAQVRVPSRMRILLARLNLLSLRWTYTRQDLNHFWHETREHWMRRAYHRINWFRLTWNLVRDMILTARFALTLALRT